MAVWNVAFIVAGLLLIALVGETYFRLTKPFETSVPYQFVDGVGRIRKPNAEVRYMNWDDDFLVISRANSQGFVDREPVGAERAADGCHMAFIGDSFVDALEVPIADKFHVRLEEMAARELPRLGVTTQAYGIAGTGQINQIPFYDEYARRLNPNVVVLVFYFNDFSDNSTALQALKYGADPARLPYTSGQRDANGALKLAPPDPEYARFLLPKQPKRWYAGEWKRLKSVSRFAIWLDTKSLIPIDKSLLPTAEWENMIAERPCCAWLLDQLSAYSWSKVYSRFKEENLPPAYEYELEYTAFGLEQFKQRADRDGTHLAILLVSPEVESLGSLQFNRLSSVAEPLGIPVISEYDYIVGQGHNLREGRWRFDQHWNATGHQWAAEAVLEWLKANQDVCD